jgi:hypothetical protein
MTKTIILRNVVAIVICLAATTGANAQTPTQSPYVQIKDLVKKTIAETEYDKKIQLYSMAVGVKGIALRQNKIACSDPEMPQIDADIIALEKEMNAMYNALVQANKTPQHKPVEYVPCEQDAAHWAEHLKGEPMPATYQQSSDIQQKTAELLKSGGYQAYCESVGTFVKIVFLTDEWEEIIGRENNWPYKILTHFRQLSVGVIVKVADEEAYRLYYTYKLTQNYNSNGGLTNTYVLTDNGGKNLFKRVQYKP